MRKIKRIHSSDDNQGSRCRSPVTLVLIITSVLTSVVMFVGSANAEVTAMLNRSAVTTEQSVQLRIVASLPGTVQSNAMSPEFNVLEKDFEILGRSSQTEVKVVDNQMAQAQSWTLELLPRREGDLIVPSFTINGETTQPIKLSVSRPQPVEQGGEIGDFYVETSVDNEKPFVQSQVILTIRVYFAINLLEGSLSSPESTDLVVQSLGEDRQFLEKRGDRQYRVLERKIALFPQKSGKIEIRPIQLNGAVPAEPGRVQGFFSPRRQIRKQSEPLTIEVQPRPDDYGSAWWLPARNVTIDGRWEGDINSLHVGESLTRSLTIIAEGTDNTQLPAIPIPDQAGFRVYADQPELSSQPSTHGLRSIRSEKWAVVAQAPGSLTLPEIRIPWFNTETGKMETAVLMETTVEVLAKPAQGVVDSNPSTTNIDGGQSGSEVPDSAAVAVPDALVPDALVTESRDMITAVPELSVDSAGQANSTVNFWKRLAIAGLAAWLITLGLLAWTFFRARLGSRGKTTASEPELPTEDSKGLLKTIRRACNENNPRLCAASTLAWAEQQFPDNPPRSLVGLAHRVTSDELRSQLNALDSAIYSGQSARLELENFPDLLCESVSQDRATPSRRRKSVLPAL